jgi:sugar transferase (PEP-CTERM/EpsH1 system associated)
MRSDADPRPLVAHVVYRFDTGGLENGVVNLINHMPEDAYRHAVVALTEVTDFAQRIRRTGVQFVSLRKPPGQGLWQFPNWWQQIRRLAPAIVHTRNLGALEAQVPAALAGVPVRIHGEHGRDMSDPDGSRRRYQWVRRAYSPLVHRYVALSRDLADYLTGPVGIGRARVTQICNGVDVTRFSVDWFGQPQEIPGCPFLPHDHLIVGTVGRMQAEKDQVTLVRAFHQALGRQPRLRLVLVGDGPLRAAVEAEVRALGLQDHVWLAGMRSDVPVVLRGLHVFVLPSRAEGISNTVLEAMASGLPVLATSVGGNAELVVHGQTGLLVPPADPGAMADALASMVAEGRYLAMGRAGRERVVQRFSLQAMVNSYRLLYDELRG